MLGGSYKSQLKDLECERKPEGVGVEASVSPMGESLSIEVFMEAS